MNTTNDTPANHHNLGPARPSGTRRNRIRLLDAALAAQVAVWVVAAFTASNLRSAVGQAHPGLRATLVIGGAIWLSQFAVVVMAAHMKSRRHAS